MIATDYATVAERRSKLVAAYRQLPELERQMVQLFSVIYEPISRTIFLECLNFLGVKDESGRTFFAKTLKPYLDRLIAAEILIQESGHGPQCHPLLVEIATRDAVEAEVFESFVSAVENCFPVPMSWNGQVRNFRNSLQFIREVRIGIYCGDAEFIERQYQDYQHYSYRSEPISLNTIFERVCNNPFDADWFRTLPPELYESSISSLSLSAALNLTPAQELVALLQEGCSVRGVRCSDFLRLTLTEQLLLRGCLQEAEASLEGLSADYWDSATVYWGWLTFLQGDAEQAIAHYGAALKALKKGTRKRKVYFRTMGGLFFILALLQQRSPECLREASDCLAAVTQQSDHWLGWIYRLLERLLQFQQGDLGQKAAVVDTCQASHRQRNSLETFFSFLCLYWVDADGAKKQAAQVLQFCKRAQAAGYDWLAMEAAELLSRLKPNSPYGKQAAAWRQERGIQTLVDLIRPQEPWELRLNALVNLCQEPPEAAKVEAKRRLAWFISFYSSKSYLLQPREQVLNVRGIWSKGRNIALKRLSSYPGEFDYLKPQDLRVCAQIESYSYGYYGKTEYKFGEKAIAALVGHPLVFWEDSPTTRVEIVRGEPELLVKQGKGSQLTLQFSPQIEERQDIMVVKETPTRLKVIEINDSHRRISTILGEKNSLKVPLTARDRVLAAINAVSGIVTVHSDIGGGVEVARSVTAETTPHVHLLPAGSGLKVALLMRPFADGGPYFCPGMGGAMVIAQIGGERQQTARPLPEEVERAQVVRDNCPTLARVEEYQGEWLLDDPEDCLELLLELQALGDRVVVEWPEGETLRIKQQGNFDSLHLNLQRQRAWFAVSGELQLDDELVLSLQQLLELLENSPSRFVPLGDGQFLALTREFRQRLAELAAYSEKQGQSRRFHPLAALALEEVLEGAGSLKADRHWQEHLQRLKDMEDFQPQLPSTLQAELRDYQLDGFSWLSRLAHWGVGACLADDMGLGKTVQALATILTRAAEGPTLIVAPTSVCFNWLSEAQRFAPTLNPLSFGSGNRQEMLDNLQPFDLLTCSYGLLQQREVAQMLSRVHWRTIVLDEAQAIKNSSTKRSQAAMKLQGDFKLITTGTPIENHLGELWNLFRFINPGLLGSLESFNQRFATPIEKFGDKQARNRLKKLVQPFLLRRTKSQVLDELPSRTEILLQVELSEEERALYEALRRDALFQLESSDATAGAKHLQVLAAIMKLRRACCNPALVLPDATLPSAKLELFGEITEELLENRHKALVFSQFVDHLQIVRSYLEARQVNYQYLDGSTPAKERQQRVNAFQAGEGDVFLISLKAGGTGLNLTAADYVIHLDPWWNPAVEDQASDRAHRLGQQRPVTIYRLVAKDTIEEKIVDLHCHKRDLADSLLEGADVSGKLSTEELLRLMGE